jgi:hypothetical protein
VSNFPGGATLDVAVGLVLMYLMLALVGTVVNEYIATLANLRAKTLESALTKIIDDRVLRGDFYDSGVIAGAKDAVGGHVSYLSSRDFATAVLNSLDPTKPVPIFADVKQSIQLMADSNIRDVLLAHVATADDDVEKLRDDIAAWFDGAMDRISGVYKRYLKYISLGVGVAIAILFNADSVHVGSMLWQDTSLRSQMVKAAMGIDGPKPLPASSAAEGAEDLSKVKGAFDNAEATLKPLPIGWSDTRASDLGSFAWWPLHIFGWLLTGLAVSLGAPFWFDILTKVMNVRGAGPKPARSDPT